MSKLGRFTRMAAIALAAGILLAAPVGAVDTLETEGAPDLTKARALIKVKRFAEAREELFRLANSNQHADLYNLLGFSLRKTGDYVRALTYYQKALDFDPNHRHAREYLGELYLETNQPEKAREQHAILVRLCPQGCDELEDLEQAMKAAGVALSTK